MKFFKNYWPLLLIVTAKMVLQYVLVNPFYELHRDEFLHLDQAHHLALGYISVPPLTSFESKLIFLLGGSEFWVRFFPALFGAFTIVFAWLIAEALNGKMISKLLVSIALLFSVLIRLNILFQPNAFDIMIWTIIFFFLVKYAGTSEKKWIWFAAIAVVLGLYNKYNTAFLIAGLFAGILLTGQRKILALPVLWKAVLLAIVLFLPNLIWQASHDFPVVNHMRVLKEYQLDNNSAAGFLKSQVYFFIGSLPLTVAAFIAFVNYKPFRPYRFVGFSFIVTMAMFTFFKAKDYYAVGLFPVIFAFGAVFFEKALDKSRLFVIPALMTFNLVIFLSLMKLIFPVLSPAQIIQDRKTFEKMGMLRWEDGKNHQLPQDFADMTGWKEMAEKALEAYKMIPESELGSTLVFCDNYGQTGALNYYNRGKMKEAYSFNTDYIYWLPRIAAIKNVLLVGDPPEERVIKMFRSVKRTGEVENIYAREKGTGIYLLTDAEPSFTVFFYDEAERRKNELDIF